MKVMNMALLTLNLSRHLKHMSCGGVQFKEDSSTAMWGCVTYYNVVGLFMVQNKVRFKSLPPCSQ